MLIRAMVPAERETMMPVSFDISASDATLVEGIVLRVESMMKPRKIDVLSMRMDLTACHANGCKMDFARLLQADDFSLVHDVFGVQRYIDRETGKLEGFFRPRFAAKAAAASVEG